MQGTLEFWQDVSPGPPTLGEGLFFTLLPTVETCRRVERLRDRIIREYHLTGKPRPANHLHVSLGHVDHHMRLRTKFVHAARRAGCAVSMRPFDVTFHSIMSFGSAVAADGRPRPLVLLCGGEALFEFHKILGAAMKRNGLRVVEHFAPHMTLLYDVRSVLLQPIEPIRFVVSEFALVHSEVGRTRYNVVDRWPLKG